MSSTRDWKRVLFCCMEEPDVAYKVTFGCDFSIRPTMSIGSRIRVELMGREKKGKNIYRDKSCAHLRLGIPLVFPRRLPSRNLSSI